MDLQPYVVHEGSEVSGTGVVTIDGSGGARLSPNTPFSDPRQAGRAIPLRYSDFDAEWEGAWVTVTGRFTHGGVDVSSVDRVDRPDFPGDVTVRVTNPGRTGWTADEQSAVTEHTDLHSTDDQIYGSGTRREKNGTDTVTLDCLYIDDSLADWLCRTHPGDIEVRCALVPREISTPEVRAPVRRG